MWIMRISCLFFVVVDILLFVCLTNGQESTSSSSSSSSSLSSSAKQPPEPIQLTTFVRASNDFGFKLFQQINPIEEDNGQNGIHPKNILLSPIALSTAMAMLHEGADGDTASQIERLLGIPSDNTMVKEMIQNASLSVYHSGQGNSFKMFNALLVQNNVELKEDYKKSVRDYYGGDVFKSGSPEVLTQINQVISDRTGKGIDHAINVIPEQFLMLLMNVVYFHGKPMYPFYQDKSRQDQFFGYNDTIYENVTYMSKFARFGFIALYDLESDLIEIPFVDDMIAMYCILPRDPNDDLSEIRSLLNATYVEKMINKISYKHESTLIMPRLRIEQEYKDQMSTWFTKLGLIDMFEAGKANFNGMNGASTTVAESALHLNKMIHHVKMNFLEDGEKEPDNERLTSNEPLGGALSPNALMFELNHPFVYFIRNKLNGQIYLMGEQHTF